MALCAAGKRGRGFDGSVMIRLLTLLIVPLAALTGCGEVVVFGHVVREDPSKTEATVAKPATDAAAPKPATATNSTHASRQTSAPAAAGLPAGHVLHAVNVTLSPASQAGDSGVDAAALLDAIQTELRSRNLLDEQNPAADGTAEVLIENVTARPTVNAVVFGKQPMAGTLTGELRVSSTSGEELPTSRIVAESRLTIADDGHDKNPLGPLYRRFAVLTADELTGIASNPSKDAGRQSEKP
jgi:hypothetical protein